MPANPMRVLVKGGSGGSILETEVVRHLRELDSHETTFCSSGSAFLDDVEAYCFVPGASELCVIVNAADGATVEALVQLLRLPTLQRRPRVLLFSTIQTWAGKSYGANSPAIENYKSAFASRLPTSAANIVAAYASENLLYNLAATLHNSIEIAVIGVSLLYGGAGWDLEAIFREMWDATSPVKLLSLKQGKNKVPMLHYQDFLRITTDLVNSPTLAPFTFLPMTDGSEATLDDIFTNLTRTINGSEAHLAFPTQDEYLEELLTSPEEQPRSLLWNIDISFKKPETQVEALSTVFDRVWKEYLEAHKLRPVSVVIAGNPKAGKSEVAATIASTLKIEVVNVSTAVTYVLRTASVEGDTLSALRADIMAVVEAKQAEGKKPPKKGEEAPPATLDPLLVEVNDALSSTLSQDLARRAVALMLQTHTTCIRKGFVVDAWDSSITSADSLHEILTGLKRTEGADETPALVDVPELLVELQCADSLVMRRYLASLGIPDGGLAKASKENQAAVKALETTLSAYAAQVKPVERPDVASEGDATAEAPVVVNSHAVVQELERAAAERCSIGRFDTGEDGQLDSVAMSVCMLLLEKREGVIGWLPDLKAPKVSPDLVEPSQDSAGKDETAEGLPVPSTANPEELRQDRSLAMVNGSVCHLSVENRTALVGQCDELQQYLLSNVMPCLVKGMVATGKDRPEDPVLFIAQFLQVEGQRLEAVARQEAFENFQRILQEARRVEKDLTA